MSNEYVELTRSVLSAINQCMALRMKVVDAGKGTLTLELPYHEDIVGNPDTGIIHGGALTTLMDSACGFAVPLALEEFQVCPTLDLRIDYICAAKPGQSVFGTATVYRVSTHVIFVRGVAWQDSIDKPIANCVATFMRIESPENNMASSSSNDSNQGASA